jgi:hypothetical protein
MTLKVPEFKKQFNNNNSLAIDRLDTFIKSDIAHNEKLKKIFADAGCQSLFELDEKLIQGDERLNEKHVVNFISHYLGLE